MEKVFELPKKEICTKIETLMLKKNIVIENRQIILKSLEAYSDFNVNFADAYICIHSFVKGQKKVFSFNKHFEKFENIEILP